MLSGAHISIHILDIFGPRLARLGDMFNGKNPRLPSAGPPFRKVTFLFAKPKPMETCPIFHGTQELGIKKNTILLWQQLVAQRVAAPNLRSQPECLP